MIDDVRPRRVSLSVAEPLLTHVALHHAGRIVDAAVLAGGLRHALDGRGLLVVVLELQVGRRHREGVGPGDRGARTKVAEEGVVFVFVVIVVHTAAETCQ